MGNADETTRQVLLIVDPNFGDRLRHMWSGQPVWIVMSPANEPVIRSLRAIAPSGGITGFTYNGNIGPEDRLLTELDIVDLHHGQYSTKTPYTTLKVIGVQLTTAIQTALAEFGFSTFEPSTEGFIAIRSEDEAACLRG